MIYEYPLKIRERHLDTFGHVNNAVYLEIFEEARWEIINAQGYDLRRIQQTGIGPVILEIGIRFLRELKLHDQVVVKSEARPFAGKIGVIHQWIESSAGERCCEADFKMALFDVRARKIVDPTPDWLAAVGLA